MNESPILTDMSVNFSSNPAFGGSEEGCIYSTTSIFILATLFVTYIIFLLPLFVLVLFVAFQRWRKQRSNSQAGMNSHSDVFTYNMVTLELIGIFGTFSYCYAAYSNQPDIMFMGQDSFNIISTAQSLFHILTCADRYLAVAHPVTYLRLRQTDGVRFRNITIICVWLLCIGSLCLTMTVSAYYSISSILFLTFSFILATFCSLSVLCVLIRPGPGEVGGNRERVDHSKKRAFYTIMAIMGALFSRFLTILVYNVLSVSSVYNYVDYCLAMPASSWSSLPSSLVLPLLFLQRAGRLPCCKKNIRTV